MKEEGPIEVRITANRRTYYIGTGLRVRKDLWISGKVADLADWPAMEERINIIKAKIDAEVNDCIMNNRPIKPDEIRRKVWNDNNINQSSFLEWAKTQIPTLNVRNGTRSHYSTLLMRIEQFKNFKSWSDITSENICLFDSFLRRLEGRDGKITDASVYSYHKNLKKLLNQAVLFNIIDRNPYDRLRGKFSRGDVETVDYLTIEELQVIQSSTPTPGSTMEIIRDLFIFQAFTGLSYSDMMAFDIKAYTNINGTWSNTTERIKTGVPYVSQLLPPAVEVLERHNWIIPHVHNAKYNLLLKALGEMLGMTKSLTSHMARHTFATMMLRYGAKIENVSRMLGHTNIKQTERYAKVMAVSVHEDFTRISNLINIKK